MLGFALAAIMTMALVGTSSAFAESTALCNIDPGAGAHEVCPSGNLLTHLHLRTLVGRLAKLLSSFLTSECDVLFLGDVTNMNNLGNPLEVLGHLTYTNCSCVYAETSTHTIFYFLKLGHELADVTFNGQLHVVCGSSLDCEYKYEGLNAHALGPLLAEEENGEIRLEGQELKKVAGGFLCPKTSQLDLLLTPYLDKAEIELAEKMNEPFRSGPTYITE